MKVKIDMYESLLYYANREKHCDFKWWYDDVDIPLGLYILHLIIRNLSRWINDKFDKYYTSPDFSRPHIDETLSEISTQYIKE